MWVVVVYSLFLGAGIVCSQTMDLSKYSLFVQIMTSISLSVIMMDIGLEFNIDKTNIKSYGWDFCTAFLAAVFPWILCAFYFCFVV